MDEKTRLKEKADEINNIIKEKIVSDNPNLLPIYDGILDIDKYFNAKYKIMWILKEPYADFDENGNPEGGGQHIRDIIVPKQTIQEFSSSQRTFRPMIYASWSILNNFILWEDLNDVNDDPLMIDALRSVAYINVKKIPGHTESNRSVIDYAYQQHKDILLKQIEYYNPDIIIGGYTLYNFLEDLGIKRENMVHYNSLDYIVHKQKLFIDPYHPAQHSFKQQDYCNDIINCAKKNIDKIAK